MERSASSKLSEVALKSGVPLVTYWPSLTSTVSTTTFSVISNLKSSDFIAENVPLLKLCMSPIYALAVSDEVMPPGLVTYISTYLTGMPPSRVSVRSLMALILPGITSPVSLISTNIS